MIKERITKMAKSRFSTAVCLGIALFTANEEINAQDIVEEQATPVQCSRH